MSRLFAMMAAVAAAFAPSRAEFNPDDMFPKAPAPRRYGGRSRAPRSGLRPRDFEQNAAQAARHLAAARVKRTRKNDRRIVNEAKALIGKLIARGKR